MTNDLTPGQSAVTSTSLWGALIAIAPALLSLLGEGFGIIDTAAQNGLLGPHGIAIAAVIGSVVSAYGRVTAEKKITTVLPKTSKS